MLARMPRGLWQEWQAYFEIEPWGGPQDDLRAGYMAAMYHNAHRKDGAEAKSPGDFFPSLRQERRPERPLSVEVQCAMWRAYVRGRGGKVKE
jgi:hypothetical protein